MKISYEEAKNIAISFLKNIEREMDVPLLIVESKVQENADGWFFPYQSKAYLETMDINKSIMGNWPIFVTKSGGNASIQRF